MTGKGENPPTLFQSLNEGTGFCTLKVKHLKGLRGSRGRYCAGVRPVSLAQEKDGIGWGS